MGNQHIAGSTCSSYPINDDCVDVVQKSLHDTDTCKIWLQTDHVNTTVRVKLRHGLDGTNAMMIHAAKTGKHVAFQATYSIGCPGDSEGDVYLSEDDNIANLGVSESGNQYAAAKFSLYPLGGGDYMDIIYEQIDAMKEYVSVK